MRSSEARIRERIPHSTIWRHLRTNWEAPFLWGIHKSAFFPQRAAFVDATNIKGMITLETGLCPASFLPDQIAIMAKSPMIILYGDHKPVGQEILGCCSLSEPRPFQTHSPRRRQRQ